MHILDAIKQRAKVHHSTPALKQKLDRMLHQKPVVLVALCGETASGKTTFLNAIKQNVTGLSVISADNYFADLSEKIKEHGSFSKLVESGYDTESAEAFQMDTLARDLKTLKQGHDIYAPQYQMNGLGTSIPNALHCPATKIVVVEGICTLYDQVRDEFDLKIYLTVDRNEQRRRYMKRAMTRGQSDVEKQFDMVTRAAEKHIVPNKRYADLVIEDRLSKDAVRHLKKHKAQMHAPETGREREE